MEKDLNSDRPEQETQATFEAKFHLLTDGFGKACIEENIELAIAIAIHPDLDKPIIFVRGHQYDVTAVMAEIVRRFKSDLMHVLTTD